MNVLILAAGYGTRLAKGIEDDQTGNFNHLKGLPKALLPIGIKPLINHWIDELVKQPFVDDICVISNDRFYNQFEEWYQNQSKNKSKICLLNDGTKTNETRLGAIGSIKYALDNVTGFRNRPLLVIGGDTLFFDNFSISNFHDSAKKSVGAHVTAYTVRDDETTKYGIIELDKDGVITGFLEKPEKSKTNSRLACPCFYYFKQKCFDIIDTFLLEKENSPIKEKDATGIFLAHLYPILPISSFPISGRYDVGNLQQYIECSNSFVCD
jgi:dTDP-glucose pyrophosphorylase